MDWWKARSRWQKVALVALAAFVGIAILAPDVDEPGSGVVAAATTTTAPVTTTADATTTTTQTTTTTTVASTTTTLDEETLTALKLVTFAGVFDGQKAELAGLLEDGIFHLDSVDILRYEINEDATGATLFMAATSGFPSLLPGDLPDDGWDIMQAWKAYFSSFVEASGPDGGRELVPDIVVDLSGHTFTCPRQFVLDLLDLNASQADFIDICINS